VKVHVTDGRRC